MLKKIKQILLRKALNGIAGQLCSFRISFMEERDCYAIHLNGLIGPVDFLATGLEEKGIQGLLWDGSSYEINCSIPYHFTDGLSFSAKHYLSGRPIPINTTPFHFSSPTKLLIWKFFRFAQIVVYWENLQQRWFLLISPVRKNRIDILRTLVEMRIEQKNSNNKTHIIEIIEKIYGDKAHNSGEYQKIATKIQMTLESLVSSEDINENNGTYFALGKALSTIAQYEEENRRHKEQILLSRLMVVLTLVISISTAYQIFWLGNK